MKILIIGCGSFGLALANVLTDNKHEVVIYARNKGYIEEFSKTQTIEKYLPNEKLNKSIVIKNEYVSDLETCDYVLFTIPSKNLRLFLSDFTTKLKRKINIINAIKGMESETSNTIQSVIKECIDGKYINSLISILGPGFAKEIVHKNITCVCSVSDDLESAKKVQKLFSNSYFRVYASSDVIGSEIYSSYKNAIAIACGILLGLGYKDNSRAALITRSLKEMKKLGEILGAKKETFFGLTGLGDLILTCSSFESRNLSFGYEVGKNNDAKSALEKLEKTVEGIATIKVIKNFCTKNKIELVINDALYEVIYNNKKPSIILDQLMNRALKTEF